MDGSISRTLGVGPTINLCGNTLTVKGRILQHYAEIEAEIMKMRGNPFDLLRESAKMFIDAPQLADTFLEKAFEKAKDWRCVQVWEYAPWLQTMDGKTFKLWLAVRDNDREKWTLDHVRECYSRHMEWVENNISLKAAYEWLDSIESAIAAASADDELGNLIGVGYGWVKQVPKTETDETEPEKVEANADQSAA